MEKNRTTQTRKIGFNANVLKINLIVLALLVFNFMFIYQDCRAQELDVPYVPTPENVVEKMLDMANVGPGDYVIDLGSGDGRIVIAAAKRGAYGHGVDLNPKRIKEAKENAQKAGVEDKVIFVQGNIFETDFSRASVVTMYLLNSVNIQLRPGLLANLKPGSRLVSHDFDMGDWKSDQFTREETSDIYFWVIPAYVKGLWKWEVDGKPFLLTVNQEFQEVDMQLRSGRNLLSVTNSLLSGGRISFTAASSSGDEKYIFSGRVEGKHITGVVQVRKKDVTTIEDWNATME